MRRTALAPSTSEGTTVTRAGTVPMTLRPPVWGGVGEPPHRAGLDNVGGDRRDPRAHRADDLEAARVGGARRGRGLLLHAEIDVDRDLLVAEHFKCRRRDAGE